MAPHQAQKGTSMHQETSGPDAVAVEDVIITENDPGHVKNHNSSNVTTIRLRSSTASCNCSSNDPTNTADHKDKSSLPSTPTLPTHHHNHSITSHSQNPHKESIRTASHNSNHRKISPSQDSLRIQITENPSDQIVDSSSRKRLWNPSKATAEHGVNDVTVDNEDIGCSNPTFVKSESVVDIDVEDNDADRSDAMNKTNSFSRQNSMTRSYDGKSEKEPNTKNVL